jgi:hypothetical protein
VLRLTEIERRLIPLRVTHADNFDIRRMIDIVHRLRRDENELSSNRASRGLDNHLHAAFAVDTVHKDIEFVQAADGRAHGIPQCEQKTNGRVGLLTTRECLRLPAIATSFCDIWLHVDVEKLILVVDAQRATELALTEEVVERDPRSNGDTGTELLPSLAAAVNRVNEMLSVS